MQGLTLSLDVFLYTFKLWSNEHNSSAQESQNFNLKNANFQLGRLVLKYQVVSKCYMI